MKSFKIMHKNTNHKNKRKGFTLIEMLVVIGIIAMIAAFVAPSIQRARTKSQTTAITANLKVLADAADQYFLDNGGTEVNVADLVGVNAYIKTAPSAVAGETYPTKITVGTPISTGGTVVTYPY